MSCIVPRTCTEVREAETERARDVSSRPLAAFREVSAYVLLGDPGSGKSTSFAAESTALGGEACLESARDFLTLDPNMHPEWCGKTLFIDGLDEVRAGGGDVRTPLDELRRRIDALGRPRFRLSCREADWLGTNDRSHLAKVSSGAGLTLLRLDPLSDQNIAQILNARSGLDARSFIATAREKGVAGFLENPQCLKMLADVVTDSGGWPGSRLDLFEQACLQVVREHNPEHVAAARRSSSSTAIPEEDVLCAAGRLCAVVLVSGAAGSAVQPGREDAAYPDLSRCAGESREAARQAISTNLFNAVAEGRYEPVHRHVAEFLAGRYLARVVDGEGRNGRRGRNCLPARRIIALIAGHDGGVVTALRGLSAWIAAHSRTCRSELIQRDPVGVALYGDATRFSAGDKTTLLKSLVRERESLWECLTAAWLDPARPISPVGTLAEPATEQVLRDILTDPHRDDAQETFVLRVLQRGVPLPGLTDVLVEIIRNGGRRPGTQLGALYALFHNSRGNEDCTELLKKLLTDIRTGKISDPDHCLLGALLTRLYPGELSPSDVWACLAESDETLWGTFFEFWRDHLVSKASAASAVAEHLDILVTRRQSLPPAFDSHALRDIPADLLAHGLRVHGDDIDAQRLYDWLGVGLASSPDSKAVMEIRTWLTVRPETQKMVLTEGLKRCAELDEVGFMFCTIESERRRYRAGLPADFGVWCLRQAKALAGRERRVAEYFLSRSWSALQDGIGVSGLSRQVLEAQARKHDVLNSIYEDIRTSHPGVRRELSRHEQLRRDRGKEEERRHQDQLDHVRSHETALHDNRCPPAVLHQLAAAYLGLLSDVDGRTPEDRLNHLFREDRHLVAATLAGLRGTIHREDLPDVEEILRLRQSKREHFLALPVLASMAEIHEAEPTELGRLGNSQIRKALAFHYCTRGVREPVWYKQVLDARPDMVADVLMQSATAQFRGGCDRLVGLRELALRADHAEVARRASLDLLRSVPLRGTAKWIDDVDSLLWSALKYAGGEALRKLIRDKLARRSMDVAQRVHWLAAGLLESPEDFLGPLESCVRDRDKRVQQVAAFLDAGVAAQKQTSGESRRLSVALFFGERLGEHVLSRLVHSIARAASSHATVSHLIHALAVLPTARAGAALETLESDPALSPWHAELIRARDEQRVIRRDAAFRHPDVEQICRTLNDGPPANPADLAALVTDRLGEIASRIRNDNTNGWRPFWNEDRYRQPDTPKHEESCRDSLLRELRYFLPEDTEAEKEVHYADDKRADIRISCGDFQIPVEIKKNSHPKLWSALQDQLIFQYTRDPATDGYGIYLVLWFGEVDGHRKPPPPSGVYPDSPEALKVRLEEALTPEAARKISVCVIDVSASGVETR